MRMGKSLFYSTEHIDFPDHFSKKLSWIECEIVHKKLCRHYKINSFLIYRGRVCGRAFSNGRIILGVSGMNVGVICHEFAHLIAYRKYGHFRHNRQMYRIMCSVMNFVRRKNYWSDELSRRTVVKEPKPEPSKNELLNARIIKRSLDIVRYEKKLAYYTKFYGNKIIKARRSLVMLKKYSENL